MSDADQTVAVALMDLTLESLATYGAQHRARPIAVILAAELVGQGILTAEDLRSLLEHIGTQSPEEWRRGYPCRTTEGGG